MASRLMTPQQLAAYRAKRAGLDQVTVGAKVRTGPGDSFRLILPWPPTLNHNRKPNGRGGHILTEEYLDFRSTVHRAFLVGARNPLSGRMSVAILAYPADERVRDLDNIVKPILDSLQACGAIDNDCNVDELHVRRIRGTKQGCVSVIVSELE